MIGRGSMDRRQALRARMVAALAAVSLLSGCGVFKGHGGDKVKTPVLGERIPVLTTEESAANDPALASMPVTVPAPEVNDAWPQPGGGPQNAIGDVALAASPNRVWDAKILGSSKDARLAAAPVVADGRLYVMDTLARVHAFDANTGAAIWTTQVKGGENAPALKRPGVFGLVGLKERKQYSRSLYGGGVSFDSGSVYATNGLGEVAALDAKTGVMAWHKTPGGPLRGAPTIANGAIYVTTQDNQLFALNQADGSTQWSASGPLESAGIFGAASPAVGHSTVIAGYSSGDLDAYRYENGRVVWQDTLTRTTSGSTSVGDVTDIDADPIMDDTRVYAVGAGGRMVGYDLLTGQRLWEINISGISTPALGGDWLFVMAENGKLFCVQRTTGKVRWVSQLDHWRNADKQKGLITWTGPILAGGKLVLVNTEGQIAYVSPANGKVETIVKVSKKPINLPPVVANRTLYVLASDGVLSAYR